jgi:hypothetical protein
MANTSLYPINKTAKTHELCLQQRIQNVKSIFPEVNSVLETCAGISSVKIAKAYKEAGYQIATNDIDPRYKKHEPNMVVGDALALDFSSYDLVVFAPPLSKGCSGRREDSLSIYEVTPSYESFLDRAFRFKNLKGVGLVLPGKTFSTALDAAQFYQLIRSIYFGFASFYPSAIYYQRELKVKGCTKYVDLYLRFYP